jgi:excisionase family DNA binding protein
LGPAGTPTPAWPEVEVTVDEDGAAVLRIALEIKLTGFRDDSPAQPEILDGRPEVLRVKGVAEILDVDPRRVYELLATGVLHGLRVGSAWRVPRQSLEAYMAAQDGDRGTP